MPIQFINTTINLRCTVGAFGVWRQEYDEQEQPVEMNLPQDDVPQFNVTIQRNMDATNEQSNLGEWEALACEHDHGMFYDNRQYEVVLEGESRVIFIPVSGSVHSDDSTEEDENIVYTVIENDDNEE